MGNVCFRTKSHVRQKLNDDPCRCHSKTFSLVQSKWLTRLIAATCESHFTCLVALIEAGADVNENNSRGQIALHCHPLEHMLDLSHDKRLDLHDAHLQCINLLVEKGADVNIRDQNGDLPLHRAAQANHVNCVELFIELGADVNAKDNKGKTPLLAAANSGNYECIKKLIELGASVNITDKNSCSPLFILTKWGFHECLKFLIQSGADVNIQNKSNLTPLMIAVQLKDPKRRECFLRTTASVNRSAGNCITALWCYAWCDNNLSGILCVKHLLRAGAHVNKIHKSRQNALQIATETTLHCNGKDYINGDEKVVVMFLLAAGESIERVTVKGKDSSGYHSRTQDVPTYLQEFKKIQLSLKWACRETIRRKLIQSDPHTNLFIRVPKLGLPKILQSYLLYDMSVECRETN